MLARVAFQQPLACLTVGSLRQALPNCRDVSLWLEPLRVACVRFGTDTPLRLAAFLAQIGHESGDLRRLEESLDYTPERLRAVFPSRISAATAERLGRRPGKPADQEGIAEAVYGKRLGNVMLGEAWLHRGAGLIQLTGWANHDRCAVAFGMETHLVPGWLRTVTGASLSAAWFFAEAGCLPPADAADIDAVSKRINGGLNGIADRRARYVRACTAFRA